MGNFSTGALVMPSSYVVMDEDEMMYLEGGKPIDLTTSRDYLSRKECKTKAAWLLSYGYCNNMDLMDIAKEIHAHAVYGYYGLVVKLTSSNQGVRDAANYLVEKGLNGITLEDKKDSAGRVAAYNLAWPVGKA